ncbi:hypothetical protein [Nitratireductor pacificus]|nr:hypothetical protein [Nitratireductor pacificus]
MIAPVAQGVFCLALRDVQGCGARFAPKKAGLSTWLVANTNSK